MSTPTTPSLSFVPSSGDKSWGPEWVPLDVFREPTAVEELPQSAFLWDNFKVDVSLRIGSGDFSKTAASVCVLDFVLMLQAARVTLRHERLAVLELSDRQDEWCFTRDEELVGLRTRYATREGWGFRPTEGHCSAREFDSLVERSLRGALALIFSRQPATRRNPYLHALATSGFDAA
ncbi:hypothetical protein [Streptomyces parvus]|uniref:hypothetical protein n=1 Tax=Streptomyces parvus TaxID=66428 RepID=UPI0021009CF0|nr:hypothetical protein [Streptomyces parvus]MCQ1582608.1 hypothetical protein [Streptomyces parvus]